MSSYFLHSDHLLIQEYLNFPRETAHLIFLFWVFSRHVGKSENSKQYKEQQELTYRSEYNLGHTHWGFADLRCTGLTISSFITSSLLYYIRKCQWKLLNKKTLHESHKMLVCITFQSRIMANPKHCPLTLSFSSSMSAILETVGIEKVIF